jgi:hypothetical protein
MLSLSNVINGFELGLPLGFEIGKVMGRRTSSLALALAIAFELRLDLHNPVLGPPGGGGRGAPGPYAGLSERGLPRLQYGLVGPKRR